MAPIKQPDEQKCNGVKCSSTGIKKLNELIQKVAESCNCGPCGINKRPIYFDLYTLCQAYTNYDPKTYGIVQCIINKLSNPCYDAYKEFEYILNKYCGKLCEKKNFNIYTFLYDVCYGCNGCLECCYIQSGQQIYYAQPKEYTAATKVSQAPDVAVA